MIYTLALLLAVDEPALAAKAPDPGRPAWIVATVGQSEWCPAADVRLDLRSGRYAFTARAPRPDCTDRKLERPVKLGTLDPQQLNAIRNASSHAAAAGLETPACRNGGRPETLVISNGGPHILVLATGAAASSAPDDLSCWSDVAWALHGLLDETFPSDQH